MSAGILFALPAEAQYGRPDYDHRYGYGDGYGRGAYGYGYSRGYEDGFDHGKDDAEDRDGFNFWRHKEYRNGDHGYRDHYGPRWDYQRGYRGGYEVAYRRAYGHFQRRHDHDRCDDRYWSRELPRYDRPYPYDRNRGQDWRDPYDPYRR
jgi:hypothetical protein